MGRRIFYDSVVGGSDGVVGCGVDCSQGLFGGGLLPSFTNSINMTSPNPTNMERTAIRLTISEWNREAVKLRFRHSGITLREWYIALRSVKFQCRNVMTYSEPNEWAGAHCRHGEDGVLFSRSASRDWHQQYSYNESNTCLLRRLPEVVVEKDLLLLPSLMRHATPQQPKHRE